MTQMSESNLSTLYRTIVADPPWPESGGGGRGANRHYPLMTVSEIIALTPLVKSFTDPSGAHLYLWVTNSYLPQGLRVMEAWGFSYKTIITWGKDRFGLGQYFRGQSEHCLFGTVGVLPYRTRSDGKRAQGRTLFLAARREHSRKPEALQDMAELVSHPPRLEMFARRQRLGWDVWEHGNIHSQLKIV